ncbi:glycerol-3-phosphate acyltransferase [Candidatus Xianfuyuplasma coldseepsis]|uniref:Glycerol-3-phosphate acyltransferase n=1 Tax=Candidatus Xianfuyuplasma coldseepsis TaxID=2782163 RepID=A0A7L7KR24_9MOLU|nr:glycerol-3-phosphate acyltransferase [Xianfuyuplasma coldseepsis]QMS85137.1 glycerol-3-phosphate acyltransferase [Xianfuyuplasma coldseepsis]
MDYLMIAICSYLLGSINFSIVITRILKGIDIRDVNSHNPGASNATLTLGIKWGVVIFFLDVLKGFIPVFIIRLVFPENDILWFVAGFFALIGHAFPIYYKFKGGKGTSTYMGVVFGAYPLVGLILFVVLVAATTLSDYIVVGTVFLIVPPPIYMIVTGQFHWISIALLSLFAIINLLKHSNNFIALFKGEEKKVFASLKKKT